jgi:predicted DNA-binding transcriptional regulator AlpA
MVSCVEIEPLVLNVSGVAKLLCCSPRHVYKLCDEGRMPRPLKLGGINRWHRPIIEKWLSDGAPAVK